MSQKQAKGAKGPVGKENELAIASKESPKHKSRKTDDSPAIGKEFIRVIGIGASAGGLEALERFFDASPSDAGAAYVLIQHLSPNFRSMMDELLGRHSRLKFVHAEDGIALEPNTVYLNPPRSNLSLEDSRLRLVESDAGDQPNYPIDKFFESLAWSRGKDAIGVILSGTGSDGARGSNTIIRNGGMVFVQEPSTAKFESMPRSAIDKSTVTGIAAPEALPLLIQSALNGEPPPFGAEAKLDPDPERGILRLLEKHYGANFGYYKNGMVKRRLNRRAALAGLQNLVQYVEMLQKNPRELERLYCDLLIGVTAFLRDPAAFRSFSLQVITALVRRMADGHQIRVWVPGCASGEEAYSIAILFCEECRKQGVSIDLKIFATDLHHGSLEVASRGVYSTKALAELPAELREHYFDELDGQYRAKEILRNLLLFSQHNIIKDPPFSRLDAISCRNLLIYLDEIAQEKVLQLFHFALIRDGYLFLGPSETLGELGPEFETLDNHWRIYRKLRNVALDNSMRLLPSVSPTNVIRGQSALSKTLIEVPSTTIPVATPARTLRNQRQLLLETYDLILQRYAPPGILINATGEIVHIFGKTDKFLRLKPGAFSGRLADALIEPLVATVDACIDAARRSQAPGLIREVAFEFEPGEGAALVSVKAELMREDRAGGGYVLLTFDETQSVPVPKTAKNKPETALQLTEKKVLRDRVHSLESELRFTEESLQTMIEELETSNEELQSTNEELMSANQELQSTNEELHAVNEELYSVSSEHRRKIDELVDLTNDMNNLLRCTDIGTIFLDANRTVRRFTPPALRAFDLLDQDIGRPLQQVSMRFPSKHLFEDIAQVESSGDIVERTFKIDGRDMLMRIFPFKVAERTMGTVLTFIDISKINQAAQRTLEARNKELAQANESLEQFNYIVSHDLRAPLRTILNSARWIEEDLGNAATEEVHGHCQRLITYANRLSDMLTDLMNYSKVANGYEMIETIDFAIMLRAILEMVDSEGRMSVTCERPPVPFLGRKTPLQLVFRNLLENAVKYSDQAQVKVEITVEDVGSSYKFSVKDDGPGIPERYHQRIFLPFRKLEHADNKPGTGMGLALVKKAVEDNGGQIYVVSTPNERGSTFVFTWAKIILDPGYRLNEDPILNPDRLL